VTDLQIVESKEVKPGVVIARTLLDPENKNAAVRCVNLSCKEYVLKPSFHTGDAELGTVRSDEEAKPYLDCCLNQITACFGQPDLGVQAMNVCGSTVAECDSITGDQLASCSDSSELADSAIPLQPLGSSSTNDMTESFSISFRESPEGMVDACIQRDTVDVVNRASVHGSDVVDIMSVRCGSAVSTVSSNGN